ncbi:MAG: chemotaxis protein CheD [Terriglobales bacterium]
MTAIETELPEVYLQPGEVHLARTPTILKTILGSCVGVTFWSPRLGLGALCHGVLPRCPRGVRSPEGYRYVDFAIRELARQMESLGAARAEVQIKVFGGADTLPVAPTGRLRQTVGRQNGESALATLRQENLTVLVSELGGLAGRTIEFHTGTGEVLLHRLAQMASAPAAQRRQPGNTEP